MSIAFHIPVWVLWAIGGIAAIPVLGFAAVGFALMWSWRKGGPFG